MKEQGQPLGKNAQKLSKQQEKQFKRNNSNPYTSEIKKSNAWSQ